MISNNCSETNKTSLIKILQYNINKQHTLLNDCEQLLGHKVNIICAQEPSFRHLSGTMHVDDGNCFMAAQTTSAKAALVYQKDYPATPMLQYSNEYMNMVEIRSSIGSMYVLNVYIPTEKQVEFKIIEDVYKKLRQVINKFQHAPLMVLGDFNARMQDWGDHSNNKSGGLARDLIINCDLHLLNDHKAEPTFVGNTGSSYIDLAIVNERLAERYECTWQYNKQILDHVNWYRDHRPILITLKPWIDVPADECNYSFALLDAFPQLARLRTHKIGCTDEEFMQLWMDEIESHPIDCTSMADADQLANDIINGIHRCLSKCLKKPAATTRKQQPWFDSEVGRACKNLKKKLRIMHSTRTSADKTAYVNTRIIQTANQ